MTELRYQTRTTVDATDEQAYDELAEALREAVLDESTEMEMGQLRFDGNDITVRFGLRVSTTLDDVKDDRDDLAEIIVGLGLEPDTRSAVDKVHL